MGRCFILLHSQEQKALVALLLHDHIVRQDGHLIIEVEGVCRFDQIERGCGMLSSSLPEVICFDNVAIETVATFAVMQDNRCIDLVHDVVGKFATGLSSCEIISDAVQQEHNSSNSLNSEPDF